jgi:uncharacterized phiE125 gp8 family phage protein
MPEQSGISQSIHKDIMALKLITAATALAVSLVEAKEHLRVTESTEDTLITAMITAATEVAEQMTGRAIMPQTWELTLDSFPDAFELTRIPAASITSLKYYDADGVLTTMDGAAYTLDIADDYGFAYVVPAYGTEWPTAREQINAVVVRYVAGYANAAAVPESIKSWIKLQISAMYENRELEGIAQTHKIGFADRLLDRYVVYA